MSAMHTHNSAVCLVGVLIKQLLLRCDVLVDEDEDNPWAQDQDEDNFWA